MKIAVIVPFFPSLSQTFILNEVTGLIDRGHDVTIFSLQKSKETQIHTAVMAYGLLNKTRYLSCPVNKLKRIIFSMPLLFLGLKNSPLLLLKLLNVKQYGISAINLSLWYRFIPFLEGYDIIHCHFGTVGLFGVQLKRIGMKGKLVTTFHGYDIRLAIEKGASMYNELFEVGHQFVVTTDYVRCQLIEFGLAENKIFNHSLGIDTHKFVPTHDPPKLKKEDSFVVVTTARLVKDKGLQYAIEGIDLVHRQFPEINIRYHIIGEGVLKEEFKRLIINLKLKGIVYLEGEQNSEFVINMLHKCDVFLLPSVNENFGVVLLEAQAAGLPVIASAVGSTHQAMVEGKSGFLVPAKDPEAIAEKLTFFINNADQRVKMGSFGRAFVVNNFSIDKLNDNLAAAYQSLINNI